jgi:opacity protein-like surface antigen
MKTRVLAAAALCLLVSTMAFAQKVNINADRSANFASYHTYMWEASPNPAHGLWDQRIVEAVDKQLQAKGLTKITSNPDLWVVYSNSIKDEKTVAGAGYGLGPTWGWGNSGTNAAVNTTFVFQVGTLVVEIADTKDKQLVWRGSVSDTINDNSDKNIKTLDKAVAKLFKGYPPKEKK